MAGVVAQRILENGVERAEPTLAEFRDRFEPGHFFVELQDHGFPEQPVLTDILLKAAGRLELPVVASNDVHFMTKDDGIAQLYLECVGKGRTFVEEQPLHHNSFEMYLKTPDEMAALFGGVPGALEKHAAYHRDVRGAEARARKPMLPQFPVPTATTRTATSGTCRVKGWKSGSRISARSARRSRKSSTANGSKSS